MYPWIARESESWLTMEKNWYPEAPTRLCQAVPERLNYCWQIGCHLYTPAGSSCVQIPSGHQMPVPGRFRKKIRTEHWQLPATGKVNNKNETALSHKEFFPPARTR